MPAINLMDRYPKSKRPILERADTITEKHREVARRFGEEFFDGERLYGYGGYSYHPRFWQDTVKRFKDHYCLEEESSILDVGCAKGFMLHDFRELMPKSNLSGIDISEYAINNSIESVNPLLQVAYAKDLPFDDNSFDLVISITTVHNLILDDCKQALKEIQRVSRKHSFVTVDAWRNDEQRRSMSMWNLTALTAMHVEAWESIFQEIGYRGDYYWFIAE